MRFMMLMLRDADPAAEPPTAPESAAAMASYNEALRRAGVLLALDGLHAPALGARVSFLRGRATVDEEPSMASGGVVRGYWMIEARSKEEAIEWGKRCPAAEDEVVEIRQVREGWEVGPPDRDVRHYGRLSV